MEIIDTKIMRNGGVIRRIKINDKIIETPVFAPTINSNRDGWVWQHGLPISMVTLPLNELFERKKLLNDAKKKGIHEALNFNGVILIDCGGYYYSKNNIRKNVEEIFDLQREINSDVAIVLDEIPFKDLPTKEQQERIENTIENAKIIRSISTDIPLEVIIHGVKLEDYHDSAEQLLELDFDIYGVSVSEKLHIKRYREALDLLKEVRKVIPIEKPVHVLGCGSPNLLSLMTYHGADIFDSTSYTLLAAYNRYYRRRTYCARENRSEVNPLRCSICVNPNLVDRQEETQQIMFNLLEVLKENMRLNCAIKDDNLRGYLKNRLPNYLQKFLKMGT